MTTEYEMGIHKFAHTGPRPPGIQRGAGVAIGWGERECSVSEIDFMVKLLRACVGMPRRRKAKKDVVSCEKPRGDAHSL